MKLFAIIYGIIILIIVAVFAIIEIKWHQKLDESVHVPGPEEKPIPNIEMKRYDVEVLKAGLRIPYQNTKHCSEEELQQFALKELKKNLTIEPYMDIMHQYDPMTDDVVFTARIRVLR